MTKTATLPLYSFSPLVRWDLVVDNGVDFGVIWRSIWVRFWSAKGRTGLKICVRVDLDISDVLFRACWVEIYEKRLNFMRIIKI